MLLQANPAINISTDWWRALGFRFDPFQHLEASADPHLIEYMVGHEVFAAAWDATPSLLFAPPGGGKTAMRLYTERACWSSFGPRHPFPIVHTPVLGEMDATALPLAHHCQRLVRAAARSLLLGLTIQPERLLDCRPANRARVVSMLAVLPRPLRFYTDILRTTGRATALAPLLGKATWFGAGSEVSTKKLHALAEALDDPGIQPPPAPVEACAHFAEVCDLLLTVLGYRAIFVLIDGVDALPESAHDATVGARWLHSLLSNGEQWAAQNIFLKGFLPTDYADLLAPICPRRVFAQTSIQWGVESLAELLRRRVAVASGGAFGSLDAISSPALRDVETLIARRVPLLPREAIVFVHTLLKCAVSSCITGVVMVESEHLDATTAWYQLDSDRLDLNALAATLAYTR
ncbi:MAG TPA: hypothetical protein DCL15_18350 [Chloroflexi bacterium]|nr:hypothetical protein [Chloroflexota bacterium]HHW88971.1 hypothetical protein [Chloroflexota bacterium]